MLKSFFKFGAYCLLASAIATVPLQVLSQTTNKPPSEKKSSNQKKEATTKKKQGAPFHGALDSLDKVAKTITVGKRTFQITSETKIKKAGKPATLNDAVVGEDVGGYYHTGEDGKLNAVSVRFGPKPTAATDEKKKEAEKATK
jgi:hypothetical protein